MVDEKETTTATRGSWSRNERMSSTILSTCGARTDCTTAVPTIAPVGVVRMTHPSSSGNFLPIATMSRLTLALDR